MKLFQRLTNPLNKFKSMLIKFLLSGKEINLTADNTIISSTNFSVDKNGNLNCTNANISGKIKSNNAYITGGRLDMAEQNGVIPYIRITYNGATVYLSTNALQLYGNDGSYTEILPQGCYSPKFEQTSLAEQKKNFEKMGNALDIIQNIDIYKYNLKFENDKEKKHIGFVIGDNYNYAKEITSSDNKGVDLYSFVSLCCKAIQELAQENKELNKKIKEMEGNING